MTPQRTSFQMENIPARIAAIGTATPPFTIRQELAGSLIARHYAGQLKPRTLEVMRQVLSHPSIRQRSVAVEDEEQLIALKNEDPDLRMGRFTRWAVDLSAQAIGKAVSAAGIKYRDIGTLIVNTCTGYICPGISTYLVERLGLRPDIQAYDLVGSGCGGAIPCLQAGERALAGMRDNPDGVVVCVSVEICSATFQMGDDISLVVSNAIFGDGAGATVLWQKPTGIALVSSISFFNPALREDVRYVYKKGQLHNKLSPRLPLVVTETVPPMVRELLARYGLAVAQVKHWAIHPGGDKILSALKDGLGLSEEQMTVSRGILSDFGNMSSPTVVFEMERIVARGVGPGEWCVMVGFGAGFSAFACLLRG
jgi:predicted naringenin-chalcone synthase